MDCLFDLPSSKVSQVATFLLPTKDFSQKLKQSIEKALLATIEDLSNADLTLFLKSLSDYEAITSKLAQAIEDQLL